MANDNPPKQPNANRERRDKTNRIAEISHRIAEIGPHLRAAIRELVDQFVALIKQIQADSKTTDTREKEHQDRSFRWVQIGTISSAVLSFFSLATSGIALYILFNQLYSMRIEQRAWIKIEHRFEPIAENEPFFATMTIKNFGKTPAKRVDAIYAIQKVKKNDSPAFETMKGIRSLTGVINPDVSIPFKVPLFRDGEEVDSFNPPRLTKAEIDEIATGKAYAVVFGKITYLDVYGISHWINFCFWEPLMPGAYASMECVAYNEVDDN